MYFLFMGCLQTFARKCRYSPPQRRHRVSVVSVWLSQSQKPASLLCVATSVSQPRVAEAETWTCARALFLHGNLVGSAGVCIAAIDVEQLSASVLLIVCDSCGSVCVSNEKIKNSVWLIVVPIWDVLFWWFLIFACCRHGSLVLGTLSHARSGAIVICSIICEIMFEIQCYALPADVIISGMNRNHLWSGRRSCYCGSGIILLKWPFFVNSIR